MDRTKSPSKPKQYNIHYPSCWPYTKQYYVILLSIKYSQWENLYIYLWSFEKLSKQLNFNFILIFSLSRKFSNKSIHFLIFFFNIVFLYFIFFFSIFVAFVSSWYTISGWIFSGDGYSFWLLNKKKKWKKIGKNGKLLFYYIGW